MVILWLVIYPNLGKKAIMGWMDQDYNKKKFIWEYQGSKGISEALLYIIIERGGGQMDVAAIFIMVITSCPETTWSFLTLLF